ncbi:MAG: membrane or secreted protein [Saprospiraceae bacterium]|nr:membrane or secreted protein [Saprospiraceae bacterium]
MLAQTGITGAWEYMEEGNKIVSIITPDYFAVTFYEPDQFVSTFGGSWEKAGAESVSVTIEWDSRDSTNVGNSSKIPLTVRGDKMIIDGYTLSRIDDGNPGALNDAWLMTGRKQNGSGEMQTRQNGPRKTMKILSGTRFQWIAYNTETKQFSGTGGGTYSTVDGKYTENIEFFSRDSSRVGASLPFDYQIVDGAWHHSGSSSRGEPIYEVWSSRSTLE